MKNKKQKLELIAPAGNLEKMKTAFAFGADAVYLGIPDFSLRVRVNDFTMADIAKAVAYAHELKKKAYVTVNIFAHNDHLKKLPPHIKKLKAMGVDGIFVSDPGILAEVKKIWPKGKIVLSTQANCTNWQSAKFWLDQGISRIILGRELGLKEVREIKQKLPKLELECFVHGALCMSYSGRCFLSKFFNDRDANLGDCSQPCRWKYQEDKSIFLKTEPHKEVIELVEEEHGSYILNSQDLCLIKRMPELIDAGVSAFKIEGRAKSVYYLANVVGVYRKAIDLIQATKTLGKKEKAELDFLFSELEAKLYHRGYTEGFMFGAGKLAQNLDNSHKISDWEFCGQVVENKKIKKAEKEKKTILIRVHNSIKVGDEIEIVKPSYDIIKMKIEKLVDEKTGEEIKEAHGGGGEKSVLLAISETVPEYSVVRRLVK